MAATVLDTDGVADMFLENYHHFSLQQPADVAGEPGVGHLGVLGICDIRVRALFLEGSLSMQLLRLCQSLMHQF